MYEWIDWLLGDGNAEIRAEIVGYGGGIPHRVLVFGGTHEEVVPCMTAEEEEDITSGWGKERTGAMWLRFESRQVVSWDGENVVIVG